MGVELVENLLTEHVAVLFKSNVSAGMRQFRLNFIAWDGGIKMKHSDIFILKWVFIEEFILDY